MTITDLEVVLGSNDPTQILNALKIRATDWRFFTLRYRETSAEDDRTGAAAARRDMDALKAGALQLGVTLGQINLAALLGMSEARKELARLAS